MSPDSSFKAQDMMVVVSWRGTAMTRSFVRFSGKLKRVFVSRSDRMPVGLMSMARERMGNVGHDLHSLLRGDEIDDLARYSAKKWRLE
jgi:hypothetical protein